MPPPLNLADALAAAKAKRDEHGNKNIFDFEAKLEQQNKKVLAASGPKNQTPSLAVSTDEECSKCLAELNKLRVSNPYRSALINIGRGDLVADIELGELTPDQIREKLKEMIKSGDTESKMYELVSAKVEEMNRQEKAEAMKNFKKMNKTRNKKAYTRMCEYMKNIKDASYLKSLCTPLEEEAKLKLKAPLPTYVESILGSIQNIPQQDKEDAYRGVFYLLPDTFGGTNVKSNEEKRIAIYDKINEINKKQSFGVSKRRSKRRSVRKSIRRRRRSNKKRSKCK